MIATILIVTPILWAVFRLASDSHRRSQFDDMYWRQAGGLWLNTRSGVVSYSDGRPFFSDKPAAFFPVKVFSQITSPAHLRWQHEKNLQATRTMERVAAMPKVSKHPRFRMVPTAEEQLARTMGNAQDNQYLEFPGMWELIARGLRAVHEGKNMRPICGIQVVEKTQDKGGST